MKRALAVLLLSVLLVGCGRFGGTVDTDSPSFVDRESPNASPPVPVEDSQPTDGVPVDDDAFVEPPVNWTQNATISIAEKQVHYGADVAKLWVWNENGAANLLIPEGTGASHGGLKLSVTVPVIGTDSGEPRVQVVIAGESKILGVREEARVGDVWVFVSDVFLSADAR